MEPPAPGSSSSSAWDTVNFLLSDLNRPCRQVHALGSAVTPQGLKVAKGTTISSLRTTSAGAGIIDNPKVDIGRRLDAVARRGHTTDSGSGPYMLP